MIIEQLKPRQTSKQAHLKGAPVKITRLLLLVIVLTGGTCGCAHLRTDKDILFQASTIDALLVGVYDGDITFEELRRHGDFGLGTFNGLDGEMIALDGKFYQVRVDGMAYPVQDSMQTPFSVVTFFEPDESFKVKAKLNYQQLKTYVDECIPTENMFYALKVEGVFEYVKTRTVPRQRKPYPPLVDVVKHQSIFEFHGVKGTIIGFRAPAFVQGLNVPGYHLHFITQDRKAGGHLLACQIRNAEVELDFTSRLYVVLPEGVAFSAADLTEERDHELEIVEQEQDRRR
jgi:acetolactate decarboxylase